MGQKGNSEQNGCKCGGRINTMLNTYGYYEGLKRKSVLVYAAREAISAHPYQFVKIKINVAAVSVVSFGYILGFENKLHEGRSLI